MWWTFFQRLGVVVITCATARELWEKLKLRKIEPTTIYSISEIAIVLDAPVKHIKKLLADGEMKGKKIQDDYRVLGEDLLEYVRMRDTLSK